MKKLTFTFSYPPINESDFSVFEKQLGKKMPSSFRSFILMNNGGSVKEVVFREESGKEHYVNFFLPLLEGRNGSVKNDLPLVNDERAEINWLPFAFDPGGWTFCLSLQDKNYGQVYLFRIDKIYEESFDFVSNSFEEFIDHLEPENV